MSYPLIDPPPGVAEGEYAPISSSFATSYFYVPSVVEWLIVAGVLAFGALVFTLAAIVLPLRERAAEH